MHESALPRKSVGLASPAALAFAAVIVGNITLAFGPWFVRMADVGPVAAAFWRMTLASPVLFALVVMREGNPLRRTGGFGWLLGVAGLAFAADLATWHAGIRHTALANATLFGNCAVLMFPIWGFLVARAWPTRQQGTALALAAAGAALLLGRSYQLSPQNLLGDLLSLLAGTFYTIYLILMTRVREKVSALSALTLSSIAGTVPLLLVALAIGEQVVPSAWGPVIALALISQVFGQSLIMFAIAHLPPLVMGIALLLQPVVAGTVGWLVYGERLGAPDLVGAVLIAVALVLVRRQPQVAPPAEAAKSQP